MKIEIGDEFVLSEEAIHDFSLLSHIDHKSYENLPLFINIEKNDNIFALDKYILCQFVYKGGMFIDFSGNKDGYHELVDATFGRRKDKSYIPVFSIPNFVFDFHEKYNNTELIDFYKKIS